MTVDRRTELIDQLMDCYCDWRQECVAVRAAYGHAMAATSADRGPAFAAYEAALDREQSAADSYAEAVRQLAEVPSPTSSPTRPVRIAGTAVDA